MKNSIRIASGQGFWGDLPRAPVDQIRKGPIDYLVMDYLAEVSMSIMQKQKMKNPDYGYARDFVAFLKEVLPDIREKKIKIISNAGGVNPKACKEAVLDLARTGGFNDLNVGVVDGDDLLPELDRLLENGHPLKNMETGEEMTSIRDRLLNANIYFGSRPVVEALTQGSDIVITGRVADPSLTLAPMVYEFGWKYGDHDKIASGTVAGHLLECGAQASGGNFTDWREVERLEEIGFPIVEAYPDGTFYVTKHENSGGLVNVKTVKEQLVYEIGDPSEFLTPDVTVDFTSVGIEQAGKDRVKVNRVKGMPATADYKVSASFKNGYKLSSTLVYCRPDALFKAKKAGEILQARAESMGLKFDRIRIEYIGVNACNEDPAELEKEHLELNEVQLRVSASGPSKEDLDRLGKEFAPLILTGPPGVTGYAGGRPKASEVVAYWPALLDKKAANPRVQIYSP
ncbi:MAG: acyclic terpene utilization AtuA family protein [Balneolaceae bacterium]